MTNVVEGFATMDIETMNWNNKQIPIAISTTYHTGTYEKIQGITTKLFLLDYNLFKIDSNKAIFNLWKSYFDFIVGREENSYKFKTIF